MSNPEKLKKAWCYIGASDNVGCFKSLRSPTKMNEWIEGYVIDKEVMFPGVQYKVFISLTGEVLYYKYDATISYKHPKFFIRNYW